RRYEKLDTFLEAIRQYDKKCQDDEKEFKKIRNKNKSYDEDSDDDGESTVGINAITSQPPTKQALDADQLVQKMNESVQKGFQTLSETLAAQLADKRGNDEKAGEAGFQNRRPIQCFNCKKFGHKIGRCFSKGGGA